MQPLPFCRDVTDSGRATPDTASSSACLANISVLVTKLQDLLQQHKNTSTVPQSSSNNNNSSSTPNCRSNENSILDPPSTKLTVNVNVMPITPPSQSPREVCNFRAMDGASARRSSGGKVVDTSNAAGGQMVHDAGCPGCKMHSTLMQEVSTIADELEILATTGIKMLRTPQPPPASSLADQQGIAAIQGVPSSVFSPMLNQSSAFQSFKVPESRRQSHDGSPGAAATTWYRRRSAVQALATSPSMRTVNASRHCSVYETDDVTFSRDEDDNKLINGYAILGQLGKGQYGKVKLAEHQETKELVAMKIIQLNRFKGAQFDKVREKVSREIAVMKRIRHPNLVKLLEVLNCVEKGKMYLVLQFIPNGPVGHIDPVTGECNPIPEPLLKRYAAQMVSGLMALHRKGIFHRDVKPDNMLLGENDSLYIADFGVSVICSEEGVEGVEGTPAYMSPELCKGDRMVSGDAVDAWALGVTLFQLMYGTLPFSGDTPLQLTRRIVNSDPVFPDEPSASQEFVDVIKGLLHKEQDKRMTLKELSRSEWLQRSLSSSGTNLQDGGQTPNGMLSPHRPERLMSQSVQLSDSARNLSDAEVESAINTVVVEEDASATLADTLNSSTSSSHRAVLWNNLRGKIMGSRMVAVASHRQLQTQQRRPKTPPREDSSRGPVS